MHNNKKNRIKCALNLIIYNHHADLIDSMVWKKEKEINQIKYTNNIFPEAGKIVQSYNQLQIKSYSSQVTQSNTETKFDQSCLSCHTI